MKIDKQIDDYFKYQNASFSEDQISEIELKCKIRLSDEYVAFVKMYGAVNFNTSLYNDFLGSEVGKQYSFRDIPDTTTAVFKLNQTENRPEVSVRNFLYPSEIISDFADYTSGGLIEGVVELFPNFLVPIAADYGDNYFLIESAENGGRIFYWERSSEEWGTGSNTMVGLVAENFSHFLNSLELSQIDFAPVSDDDAMEVDD